MEVLPRIVHQDDAIIVVDKPAAMPSVSLPPNPRRAGAKGIERTVASWLVQKFPKQAGIGEKGEAGLVHRLDNDTSGLIVAACTEEAYHDLRAQFSKGGAKKEYTALVLGHPKKEGEIDFPIAHHSRKKKKMVVSPSGRPAHTTFGVKKFYKGYALLTVRITTGVRHQIRVHLASIGHPIAGDRLYQNPKLRAMDTLPLKRHFLHASRLTVRHPLTGKPASFSSPLPAELKDILQHLVL